MRIWIAPAARMANPVTRASNISVRVFMPPSSPQPAAVADSPVRRVDPPNSATNRRYADVPLGPWSGVRTSGGIGATTPVREEGSGVRP